ncbi:helix-turn-helix domain-containing protein [Ruania suaedae]|uniref:AraC family transcriptional regulator n=1 Tax=Ruania suaedae TaxID=2897774 RepID=UPI001E3CCAD9|nr:helix-turn-helix domain-containing protein [Ruania suaedae]UFU02874.1 helix-turn-helix domain-containing protein [Ruania suaedae]
MLWPAAGQEVFSSQRLALPESLEIVASHYWSVAWRRPTTVPFRQQVLGHPVTHLTVEAADGGRLHGMQLPGALVHGLVTRVFTIDLPVAGRVAGLAFLPGGMAALLDVDVRDLNNRVVPAEAIFGESVGDLAAHVLAEPDDGARRDLFADALAERLGPQRERIAHDSGYRLTREAIALMRSRQQVTLAPVAEQLHVSGRTLQRLFSRYVGASPLWVLRRYRLQDAVAALDAGRAGSLAELAAALGFVDHGHFTRAFTAVVGVPPSQYRPAHAGGTERA